MNAVNCPHCDAALLPSELTDGWCETCGKKIPQYIISQGKGATGSGRSQAAESATTEPATSPVRTEPRPSKPMGGVVIGLILLGIFVLNAAVSYLLAGNSIWQVVLVIAALLFAMFVFGVLRTAIFERGTYSASGMGVMLLFCGYGAALLGSGYYISNLFANVYVDNFSTHPVSVELDGKPWVTAARESKQVASVMSGAHTIVVRGQDGKELERLEVTVSSNSKSVLNILGAMTYYRGIIQYGGIAFGNGPSETKITANWFDAGVDFLFEKPPTSVTVRTRRGQSAGSASRTYLRRATENIGQ